ncbi:GntP family permease [Luteipulveratus halotolerans]|uniref:Gluconate transporter n=1 Tax=Luteipulveratus halotolerans TaxID=1631356 RepID=A0A0L6CND4_9MICO|nr:gluconate:H+ symporter [Luteipulveratus halotolerans]KNX39301.1 gluconate transporter [Luteipulveratus halotolerans]
MQIALVTADEPISHAGNTQLLLAALAGIAVVVLLITVVKLHPFISLILGSAALALVAWVPGEAAIDSFTDGFGSTSGAVGLLIALGAMLGQILADSGGADRVVSTITDRFSGRALPWGMALIAAILGLPMFFEIGVVILVPIVILVARRTQQPLMRVGIPALAGLSILHGLVPPHPGPETAISALHADQGRTLLLGLVVAVPTLVISGPLLARLIQRLVPVTAQSGPDDDGTVGAASTVTRGDNLPSGRRMPAFAQAVLVVLLPVVLMLPAAIANLFLDESSAARTVLDVLGTPSVALLIAVLVAYFVLGLGTGMTRAESSGSLGKALPGIAGIMLIVAAGGGFKQLLVDAGVGDVIADWAKDANISVLVLGWLVAVGIRLATGSATVATVTAAGIVGSLAEGMSTTDVSLLVLAIGCGSLFFSHVNDAGFWLVKEYFGLSVGQTIRSWSFMETVISVVGFAFVMVLSGVLP